MIFSGDNKNSIKNGETLLEERISLFDGKTNPIRCFSVNDLNSMNVNNIPNFKDAGHHKSYAGVWDGKSVMVKKFRDGTGRSQQACRDTAVATQMGTHKNVLRLLGCCLDTNCPILVYEWPENGSLHNRIYCYEEQSKPPLEWKERLKIGWEIAHAVAYMHTAFRRAIIHRDLKPDHVFLDQDGSTILSDFSLSISIPEGEKHVKDDVVGTLGYLSPEYWKSGKVAESSDVFGYGTLLLVLLTGKHVHSLLLVLLTGKHVHSFSPLAEWVRDCRAAYCLIDIIDPAISQNLPLANVAFKRQLKELVELALWCSSLEEEHRPTMMDVAIELELIMSLSDSF